MTTCDFRLPITGVQVGAPTPKGKLPFTKPRVTVVSVVAVCMGALLSLGLATASSNPELELDDRLRQQP